MAWPWPNVVSMPTHTLLLLRHAKSAYPEGMVDHDRPLAPRGVRQAALAGDWIRANAPNVDAVLCSTATRTRQTLARTGIEAPVRYVERIYGASTGEVIDEINGVQPRFGAEPATLLVIGHEPTISAVALGLSYGTNPGAADAISQKFPTSAIAVLRPAGSWADLTLGGAELVTFHVPR